MDRHSELIIKNALLNILKHLVALGQDNWSSFLFLVSLYKLSSTLVPYIVIATEFQKPSQVRVVATISTICFTWLVFLIIIQKGSDAVPDRSSARPEVIKLPWDSESLCSSNWWAVNYLSIKQWEHREKSGTSQSGRYPRTILFGGFSLNCTVQLEDMSIPCGSRGYNFKKSKTFVLFFTNLRLGGWTFQISYWTSVSPLEQHITISWELDTISKAWPRLLLMKSEFKESGTQAWKCLFFFWSSSGVLMCTINVQK